MFTNSMFRRTAKIARFIAVAGLLAAVAVPAGFSLGTDGAAYAQSAGGKGRSVGGGGSGPSGSGGGNSALKCVGPDCLDITAAPPPNCGPGSTVCPPKIVEKRPFRDSCEIQVCDVIYGERTCWLERAYDVRICKKERL
jgi:hypothetical protein